MHGGAVTLASEFLESSYDADLLLATDMLDLTTFLALTRKKSAHIPTAVYFHENQLAYPWSPTDRDVAQKRDKHYGFINYTTALSADKVFFNSAFNRNGFLEGLSGFLKHFPDHNDLANIDWIRAKSEVLPLGLNLRRFDKWQNPRLQVPPDLPVLLWNHRWEFDKNPTEFFDALRVLAAKGLDFGVAVLGECFSQKPTEFERARQDLGERILHFGFAQNFGEYAQWLWRSNIIPVTSNQDFFGGSIVEAIYCGCEPVLPNRLAYPELIPGDLQEIVLYDSAEELQHKLENFLGGSNREPLQGLQESMRRFDWANIIETYDQKLESIKAVE